MNSAGHQIMMGYHRQPQPTVFNYICIKFCAHRFMRNNSDLTSYQTFTGDTENQTLTQWSRLEFINSNNQYYNYPDIPDNLIYQQYLKFNGRKMRTKPAPLSTYTSSSESFKCIFDHSTSTKFCWGFFGGNSVYTDIYDFSDTTYSAPESSRPWAYSLRTTYNSQAYYNQTFGAYNRCIPFATVINLLNNPLDVSVFSRWQFYNANDTASAPAGSGNRQWIEGEIMGSVDCRNWWRFDIFNNINIPTTNYKLAYTGNIIPRYGDIWYGLDLAERDWANGISTNDIIWRI